MNESSPFDARAYRNLARRIRQATIAALLFPLGASALTAEDHLAWIAQNREARPQFLDGDRITYEKADAIRPFVPVEFQSELIYPGMSMDIKDAGDLTPSDVYKAATKKFQGQVRLAADGALENYVAGQPFDPATFTPGSEQDGLKLGWNFNYRWQYQGLKNMEVQWVWVRRGGDHQGHEIMHTKYARYYQGGGTFERVLTSVYHRVYFQHRSDLPDQNYQVPGRFAEGTEFREYNGFDTPFDIAGTSFLILRYADPHKADDSWAYIPSLRRVRRISVEVKSDSLLGTDHTLEDFYGFAGRVLEWKWKYIGTARILAVARSRHGDTIYGGPNGWIPVDDDWALRLTDVVQIWPKRENHPYSSKFIYIDRESGETYYVNAFDRAGNLWKIWSNPKNWSEDASFKDGITDFKADVTPPGTRMSGFQSINVIDVQNNRGTLVPCRGHHYPTNRIEDVKRIMDVNYLTEGRR